MMLSFIIKEQTWISFIHKVVSRWAQLKNNNGSLTCHVIVKLMILVMGGGVGGVAGVGGLAGFQSGQMAKCSRALMVKCVEFC